MLVYIVQSETYPEWEYRESETLINALWDLADLQDCDPKGVVQLTIENEEQSFSKLLYRSNQKGNDHTVIYFIDAETQEALYAVNDLETLYDLFEFNEMEYLFNTYDFKRLRILEDPQYKNILKFEFEKSFQYYEIHNWIKEGF